MVWDINHSVCETLIQLSFLCLALSCNLDTFSFFVCILHTECLKLQLRIWKDNGTDGHDTNFDLMKNIKENNSFLCAATRNRYGASIAYILSKVSVKMFVTICQRNLHQNGLREHYYEPEIGSQLPLPTSLTLSYFVRPAFSTTFARFLSLYAVTIVATSKTIFLIFLLQTSTSLHRTIMFYFSCNVPVAVHWHYFACSVVSPSLNLVVEFYFFQLKSRFSDIVK